MSYLPTPPSRALLERLSKIRIPTTMRDPQEELNKALALTNLPSFAEGREQVESAAKNKRPRNKTKRAVAKSMAEELAEQQAADAALEEQRQQEWNQRYDASIRDEQGNLKPSTPGTRWQARQDEANAAQAVIRASVAQGAKKYDNKLLGLQGPTTEPKPMFMSKVIAEGVAEDAEKERDQLIVKGITIPTLTQQQRQQGLIARDSRTQANVKLTDEQRHAMRQVQLYSLALNMGPTDERYPAITSQLSESYQKSQALFAAEREKDTGFVSPEGRDTTKQYRTRFGTPATIERGHTPLPVWNTAQYTTRVNPPADHRFKVDPQIGTPRGSREKVIPTEFAPGRTLTDHEYARWNHPEGQTHAVRTDAEERARPTKAMEYSQYNVAPQFGVTMREAGVSPEHANYEETPFIQFYRDMQAKSAEARRPSLWSNQSNPSNPTMVLQYGRKRVSIEKDLSPRAQSYVIQEESRKAWEQSIWDKNNEQRAARKAVIDADKAAREASGLRNIPRHRSLPVNPAMSTEQQQNTQGMYQRLQTMAEASAREPVVAALGEDALNDAYQAGGFPQEVLDELNRLVVHQKLYKGSQEALSDEEVAGRIQDMVADMGPVTVPTADSVGKTRTQALTAEEQGKAAVDAFRMSMSEPPTQAEQTTEALHQNIVLNTGMPASTVNALFKDVSVEQLAAIQSHANRLMISAGAGGGKSLTAFARVAYLFAKNQVQNDGLYLSGTRSGAAAMVPQIQRLHDAFKGANRDFVNPSSDDFKAPGTTYAVARSILFNSDQKVNGKTAWETLGLDKKRYSRALVSSGTGKDALSARDVQRSQFLSQEELMKKMMQAHGQAVPSRAKLNQIVSRINEIKQDPEEFKAAMKRGAELHAKYRRADVSLPKHERTHASDFVQYGSKDTLPEELQLYRYQKTLHAKEGFVLHDTPFATPHHDMLDMLYQAETAAKAGFGPRPSHIVLDEMQDSHRQEFRMVAALAGPETHIITAGDLSQMAIPTNRRPDQYAREELSAGGHEVAEQTLLLNQRTRSPILQSIANALLQSRGLNAPDSYAHGAPQITASTKGKRSDDPTIHSAGTYEEMFRQAIGHSFKDTGIDLSIMRKNLKENVSLFKGVTFTMEPRQSPTIMQTRSERALYRKVFKQYLAEHLGEEHAEYAFENLYTEELPANAPAHKFAGLLVNEAKSNSLESPKIIMQRTGKWNKGGYLLNLYTMLTRARGRARLYSSNKGLPGQTHITELKDFHGVALPPELHEVMEIAAHDLVHRQNVPVEKLPNYLRVALANPHIASPSMLNEQPALLHHLIEATTMAGTNYQPAMATSSAVRDDGIEGAHQEKDHDEKLQAQMSDGMSKQQMNAASLANDYSKTMTPLLNQAINELEVYNRMTGTPQPGGEIPRTVMVPPEVPGAPTTYATNSETMVQSKLVYNDKTKMYEPEAEAVPDSTIQYRDVPPPSQAQEFLKQVKDTYDMTLEQRRITKARKTDNQQDFVGDESNTKADFADRDWLSVEPGQDDELAVRKMQALERILTRHGYGEDVAKLSNHGEKMHDGSGEDGAYGIVNPTYAADLANLAEAKGFPSTAAEAIRTYAGAVPFSDGEQGMEVTPAYMQHLERTDPEQAAALRNLLTLPDGTLATNLGDPRLKKKIDAPIHDMKKVKLGVTSTEMAARYGAALPQSELSPLATELYALKQSLLTSGYVDPMAGAHQAAQTALPEITPDMVASLRELSISNPDVFTAYKDLILEDVHQTSPASYTPEGIGSTGDVLTRAQRDLANVPLLSDEAIHRAQAHIPEGEDRENVTAYLSLNDLNQKDELEEGIARTKASIGYLSGLKKNHRDYNPQRVQSLQELQARQEQTLADVNTRNKNGVLSPAGIRQLQRSIDQSQNDLKNWKGGDKAVEQERLERLQAQMKQERAKLAPDTRDFAAINPEQQEHLKGIHAILNDDQKMGTEFPRMLNYFMQATSGHNMVESTIKPGTNGLDAEHKIVVEHARQLLAGVTSEYRGGNRDVAGVHQMLSTLDEVSSHYAEHGTMDRSHIQSLINVLGMSRREEDHPMLAMLTRKFNARNGEDYTIHPEMIMNTDATSVPFRSAIAPQVQLGQGFMYVGGGRGKNQTIKEGEEGLLGTLLPFSYTNKDKKVITAPFGRPITNGQREAANILPQQDWNTLLNPHESGRYGIHPETGRRTEKSLFRQVYEQAGGKNDNVEDDLYSDAGRAAAKWRTDWRNQYSEPAYTLHTADGRREPVSLSQIAALTSPQAQALTKKLGKQKEVEDFTEKVVAVRDAKRRKNAARQLPNPFPAFESPPLPLYDPKSLGEEKRWQLKQLRLKSNEMQGYEPMHGLMTGELSKVMMPLWNEGNTGKGAYTVGDEVHVMANGQATGMVMRVVGNQLINQSRMKQSGKRLLSDLGDEQIKELGFMGSTTEEVRRELEAKRVKGKGYQVLSLEPVYKPKHLYDATLPPDQRRAADWKELAAYNPDFALTEDERYAKRKAAEKAGSVSDALPSKPETGETRWKGKKRPNFLDPKEYPFATREGLAREEERQDAFDRGDWKRASQFDDIGRQGTFSYHVDNNVLNSDAQTLVNTVNLRGKNGKRATMGAGLAKAMKETFGQPLLDAYHESIDNGQLTLGQPALVLGNKNRPNILNFPTKDYWEDPSQLKWIEQGMAHLATHAKDMGIRSIAFPKLGTNNGKLDWNDVGPIMAKHVPALLAQGIDVQFHVGADDKQFIPPTVANPTDPFADIPKRNIMPTQLDAHGNNITPLEYDLSDRERFGFKERDLLGNTIPGSLGSNIPWTRRYPEKPEVEAPITPDWEHGLWSYSNEGEQGRESSKDAGPSTPVAMSQQQIAFSEETRNALFAATPTSQFQKETQALAQIVPSLGDAGRNHFLDQQRQQMSGLPATPALDIPALFNEREYDKQARRAAKEGHEVYAWDDPYHSADTPPWDTTPISRFSSDAVKMPAQTSYTISQEQQDGGEDRYSREFSQKRDQWLEAQRKQVGALPASPTLDIPALFQEQEARRKRIQGKWDDRRYNPGGQLDRDIATPSVVSSEETTTGKKTRKTRAGLQPYDKDDYHIIHKDDPRYPAAMLSQMGEEAPILHARGDLSLLGDTHRVAVNTSYKPSDEEKAAAYAQGQSLAREGHVTVANMGKAGILAHKGAIEAGGRSIAVLPKGLHPNEIFPKEDRAWIEEQVAQKKMLLTGPVPMGHRLDSALPYEPTWTAEGMIKALGTMPAAPATMELPPEPSRALVPVGEAYTTYRGDIRNGKGSQADQELFQQQLQQDAFSEGKQRENDRVAQQTLQQLHTQIPGITSYKMSAELPLEPLHAEGRGYLVKGLRSEHQQELADVTPQGDRERIQKHWHEEFSTFMQHPWDEGRFYPVLEQHLSLRRLDAQENKPLTPFPQHPVFQKHLANFFKEFHHPLIPSDRQFPDYIADQKHYQMLVDDYETTHRDHLEQSHERYQDYQRRKALDPKAKRVKGMISDEWYQETQERINHYRHLAGQSLPSLSNVPSQEEQNLPLLPARAASRLPEEQQRFLRRARAEQITLHGNVLPANTDALLMGNSTLRTKKQKKQKTSTTLPVAPSGEAAVTPSLFARNTHAQALTREKMEGTIAFAAKSNIDNFASKMLYHHTGATFLALNPYEDRTKANWDQWKKDSHAAYEGVVAQHKQQGLSPSPQINRFLDAHKMMLDATHDPHQEGWIIEDAKDLSKEENLTHYQPKKQLYYFDSPLNVPPPPAKKLYGPQARALLGEHFFTNDFLPNIPQKRKSHQPDAGLFYQTAGVFLAMNPHEDRTKENWHQWVQDVQEDYEQRVAADTAQRSPAQNVLLAKSLTVGQNFLAGQSMNGIDPETFDPHRVQQAAEIARDLRNRGRGYDFFQNETRFSPSGQQKPTGDAATKPVTPTTTPSSTSTPAKPVAPALSQEAKKGGANPTTPVVTVGNARVQTKTKSAHAQVVEEEPEWLKAQQGDVEYDDAAQEALLKKTNQAAPVLTAEEKEHPNEAQLALQETHGPKDHIKAQLEEMQHAIREGKTLFKGTKKEYIVPPASAEQLAVIDDPARHMVIKAGPGSGKTTTLLKRMLGQVAKGMLPQNMLSISALRSGRDEIANQMKEWAQPLLPNEKAYTFRAPMTIHALAHHIVMASQANEDSAGHEHYSRPVLEALGYGDYSTDILQNPTDKQIAGWNKIGAKEVLEDARKNGKDAFIQAALKSAFAGNQEVLNQIPHRDQLADQRNYIEEVKKYRVIADEESRDPKQHSRYGIAMARGREDIAAGVMSQDATLAAYELHRTAMKRLDFDDQPYLATKVFHKNLAHLIPDDLKDVESVNTDESQDLTPSGLYMISSLAHWIKTKRGRGVAPALNFAHDPSQSAMAGRGGIPINELHQTIVGTASRLGPVAQKVLTENYRSPKAVVALVNSIVRRLQGMGEETSPVQKAMRKDWGKLELPRMRKNQARLYEDITHDMLSDAGIDLKAVHENVRQNLPYLEGITPNLPLGQMAFVAHKNNQHELFEHVFRKTVSKELGDDHGKFFTEQFLRRNYPERGDEDEEWAKNQITMATPANIRSHGKMNVYSDITGGGQWPLPDFYRQWLISLSRPTKQLKMYASTIPFDQKNINRYKSNPDGFTETNPDHPHPDMGLFKYWNGYREEKVISAINKNSPHPKGVVKVGPGPNDYNSPQMSEIMADAGAELRGMGAPQGVYTGISSLPTIPIVADTSNTGTGVNATSLVPNRPTTGNQGSSRGAIRVQNNQQQQQQSGVGPLPQRQGGGSAPSRHDVDDEDAEQIRQVPRPTQQAGPYQDIPQARDYDVKATLNGTQRRIVDGVPQYDWVRSSDVPRSLFGVGRLLTDEELQAHADLAERGRAPFMERLSHSLVSSPLVNHLFSSLYGEDLQAFSDRTQKPVKPPRRGLGERLSSLHQEWLDSPYTGNRPIRDRVARGGKYVLGQIQKSPPLQGLAVVKNWFAQGNEYSDRIRPIERPVRVEMEDQTVHTLPPALHTVVRDNTPPPSPKIPILSQAQQQALFGLSSTTVSPFMREAQALANIQPISLSKGGMLSIPATPKLVEPEPLPTVALVKKGSLKTEFPEEVFNQINQPPFLAESANFPIDQIKAIHQEMKKSWEELPEAYHDYVRKVEYEGKLGNSHLGNPHKRGEALTPSEYLSSQSKKELQIARWEKTLSPEQKMLHRLMGQLYSHAAQKPAVHKELRKAAADLQVNHYPRGVMQHFMETKNPNMTADEQQQLHTKLNAQWEDLPRAFQEQLQGKNLKVTPIKDSGVYLTALTKNLANPKNNPYPQTFEQVARQHLLQEAGLNRPLNNAMTHYIGPENFEHRLALAAEPHVQAILSDGQKYYMSGRGDVRFKEGADRALTDLSTLRAQAPRLFQDAMTSGKGHEDPAFFDAYRSYRNLGIMEHHLGLKQTAFPTELHPHAKALMKANPFQFQEEDQHLAGGPPIAQDQQNAFIADPQSKGFRTQLAKVDAGGTFTAQNVTVNAGGSQPISITSHNTQVTGGGTAHPSSSSSTGTGYGAPKTLPPPPAAMQPPPPPNTSAPTTKDDKGDDDKKKKGKSSIWSNEETAFGHTMTRIGGELQFLGQLGIQIADAALKQGSDYRQATMTLGKSTGATGDAGFFDFNGGKGTIDEYQHKVLPALSFAQVAQLIQSYTGSTNTNFSQAGTLGNTTDIGALATITGMDTSAIQAPMLSMAGTLGQGKSSTAMAPIAGMLYQMYGGNLSATNVSPTLQTAQELLPQLQGLNPSGGSQLPQVMALLQTGLNAGMTTENFGQISSVVNTLASAGSNPDTQQQYQLANLFGQKNLTADTGLVGYQSDVLNRQENLAQLVLQQNINGKGLTLPNLQIQISQAQITMDKAQLDMSGLQYQYSVASFHEQQKIQDAETGPIGADVSRTSYFDWMRNQQQAGYNPLSPETGTQFKKTPTFGLQNEQFYAGIEHQRSMMVLGRSPLLADAAFQENMKYLNLQEAFYKEQLKLTNDQRAFEVVWQTKLLAAQGHVLDLQEKQFVLSQEMADYQQQQDKISNDYLGQQVDALKKIIVADDQSMRGDGPLNGHNIQPADIVNMLAQQQKSDPKTYTDDAMRKKISQLVNGDPAQTNTLFQLMKQLEKPGASLADIEKQLAGTTDKALLAQLQKEIKGGAFQSQQQTASQANQSLIYGGTKDDWKALLDKSDSLNSQMEKVAFSLAKTAPLTLYLGNISQHIGDLATGIGTIANIVGFAASIVSAIGGLKVFNFLRTLMPAAGDAGAAAAPDAVAGVAGGAAAPDAVAGVAGGAGGGLLAALALPVTLAVLGALGIKITGDWMQQHIDNEQAHPGQSTQDQKSLIDKLFGWLPPEWRPKPSQSAQDATKQFQWQQDHPGQKYPGDQKTSGGPHVNPSLVSQPVSENPASHLKIQQQHPTMSQGKWMQDHLWGPVGKYIQDNWKIVTGDFRRYGGIINDNWKIVTDDFKRYAGDWNTYWTSTVPKFWSDRAGEWNNYWTVFVPKFWSDRAGEWNAGWGKIWKGISDGWSTGIGSILHFFGINPDSKATTGNKNSTNGSTDILSVILKLLNGGNGGSGSGNFGSTGGSGSEPSTVPAGHPGFLTPPVNAEFHKQMNYGQHQGVDFAASEGTTLRDFNAGQVTNAGWYPWGGEVDVNIGNGLTERYLHLSSLGVHRGQQVGRGDYLGLTGGGTVHSGLGYWSSGSHSHVQIDAGNINKGVNPWDIWALSNTTNISQYYGATKGAQPNPVKSHPRNYSAEGGVALSATTTTVGEGGQPEAIVPLSQLSNLAASIMGWLPSSSQSAPLTGISSTRGKSTSITIGTINLTVGDGHGKMSAAEKDSLFNDLIGVLDAAATHVSSHQE